MIEAWEPPDEPEPFAEPSPQGPVHIGRRAPATPVHLHLYAGLAHVSRQVDALQAQVQQLTRTVAALEAALRERSPGRDDATS